MFHRSLLVVVPFLLICFSARAQESTPLSGLDESAAAAAVRKKAMNLLVSVAGQVDSLRSAENRARIGSNLGDLLWEHDEKRARTLFAAVAEDIKSGFNETDTEDAAQVHTMQVFWRLRSDTLGRIAKHDPELALEFLRGTRIPEEAQFPRYLMDDNEEALELRLASQIAAKNPQLALKLGRQSLAEGFTSEVLSFLSDLRRKDKETSLAFYKEIVEKLKSTNLEREWQETLIALDLVRSFQPPDADEQVYRDLLGVLLTSALASCSNAGNDEPRQICYLVGSIFPRLEKYYGSRAAPLKRWFDDGPEARATEAWTQIQDVAQKGTIDEVLALRTKFPEMETQIYWSAMAKARAAGDLSRVREIASRLPLEDQRRRALEELDREPQWKSMDANKLALVQQQLSGMRNDEERMKFLFQVTMQVSGNDRQAALGFLNQASQLIDSLKPEKKLEAQVALSMMYCSLKSDRAFAILEPVIPKLNELVAAATTLDGFETHYLRDGEWNMSGAGELGRLLTILAQNAGYFAALDFDRSVNLASQMERPELRLMADLKIAQGVLMSQPNPLAMFRPH